MADFFRAQMDYIYFVYGFAFFLLAAASLIAQNNSKIRLPWKWLTLFALVHGINEWLDLVVMNFHSNVIFSVARIGALALSFLLNPRYRRTCSIHSQNHFLYNFR